MLAVLIWLLVPNHESCLREEPMNLGSPAIRGAMGTFLDIRVSYDPHRSGYGIWIRIWDGKQAFVFQPAVATEWKEGEFSEPCLSLNEGELRQLIDQLWNIGIRPTSGAGSAGQLQATENHLDDMRALVGHLTKKDLPGRKTP